MSKQEILESILKSNGGEMPKPAFFERSYDKLKSEGLTKAKSSETFGNYLLNQMAQDKLGDIDQKGSFIYLKGYSVERPNNFPAKVVRKFVNLVNKLGLTK